MKKYKMWKKSKENIFLIKFDFFKILSYFSFLSLILEQLTNLPIDFFFRHELDHTLNFTLKFHLNDNTILLSPFPSSPQNAHNVEVSSNLSMGMGHMVFSHSR